MNNSSSLELSYGTGSRGGMTIQVAEGAKSTKGQAPSIYLTDDAFSFLQPALARHAAQYSEMSRWGVTEVTAAEWLAIVKDLRTLLERFEDGGAPKSTDFEWVHTFDLDNDTEIDGAAFGRQFNDPAMMKALREFLAAVADWIEQAALSRDVLTVFGY